MYSTIYAQVSVLWLLSMLAFLKSDIELAKELSLQDMQSSQHRCTPDQELQLVESPPWQHTRQLSPVLQILIPPQQLPINHSKSSQRTPGNCGAPPLNTCLEPSPLHDLTSPVGQSNSPPSNGSPADEEPGLMWEDEELARVLSLSLHEQQQQIQQQSAEDCESLLPSLSTANTSPCVNTASREQWLRLPSELRHLLQDSHRSGQSV